jgi:hypothetical protein
MQRYQQRTAPHPSETPYWIYIRTTQGTWVRVGKSPNFIDTHKVVTSLRATFPHLDLHFQRLPALTWRSNAK